MWPWYSSRQPHRSVHMLRDPPPPPPGEENGGPLVGVLAACCIIRPFFPPPCKGKLDRDFNRMLFVCCFDPTTDAFEVSFTDR